MQSLSAADWILISFLGKTQQKNSNARNYSQKCKICTEQMYMKDGTIITTLVIPLISRKWIHTRYTCENNKCIHCLTFHGSKTVWKPIAMTSDPRLRKSFLLILFRSTNSHLTCPFAIDFHHKSYSTSIFLVLRRVQALFWRVTLLWKNHFRSFSVRVRTLTSGWTPENTLECKLLYWTRLKNTPSSKHPEENNLYSVVLIARA